MYNINNFTAVCAKYVHFTLHLLCCLLVHPDKFLILCKWLLRYYYWTYYSDMRHGDRPHNYVSNYIFGFAISSGLTKILPIEKCIILLRHPVSYTTTLLHPHYSHLSTHSHWTGSMRIIDDDEVGSLFKRSHLTTTWYPKHWECGKMLFPIFMLGRDNNIYSGTHIRWSTLGRLLWHAG